jgi:hypothetical protein
MEIYMSKHDVITILSEGVQMGFKLALETLGESPKNITQNKAHKIFGRSRVENWVKDGLIAGKPNGNGRNSTIFYEYAKLMQLDASERIKIRKPYNIK